MKKFTLASLVLAASLLLPLPSAGQEDTVRVSFIGRLANFEGPAPGMWARIAVDGERKESLVLSIGHDLRFYNLAGMETFRFGDNLNVYSTTDIDLGEDGNIYLVYPREEEYKILRLDYKGEPLASIALRDFPEDFLPFTPRMILYRGGMLYLADPASLDIAVTDIEGFFQRGYHLKPEVKKFKEKELRTSSGEKDAELLKLRREMEEEIFGFHVDRDDAIFITVPTLFTVFKFAADGTVETFGTAGGAPGKFGVISGIHTDEKGNIYVADRLRCKVLIFDSEFTFQTEFGFRGYAPEGLIAPDDVVVDDTNGLIYVSQAANRGVNVYRLTEKSAPH